MACLLAWYAPFALPLALVPAQGPSEASAPAGIVSGELAQEVDAYLARCVPFGFSGTVLVVQGDGVILSKGYGIADALTGAPCAGETIYDLGSLTKQLTAALVLELEEQKKLKVTETLERFFPDAPKDKRSIQIHHLLTHTSGLPRGLPTVGSRMDERSALIEAALAAPLASQPGAQHVYSNLGYELLAAVVEIAADQPFEDALRALVLEPAGMTSTGFRQDGRLDPARAARGRLDPGDPPPPGSLVEGSSRDDAPVGDERTLATEGWYSWGLRGAGGVLTTVQDLWLWEQALRGNTVLGEEAREKLFKPFRGEYAYGWYVTKTSRGTPWIEHGGSTGNGFEAKYTRYPKEKLFFTVLGNSTGVVPWVNLNVGKLLLGEPYELPPAALVLPETELQALAGEYEGKDGFRARVFVHGGALVLEATSESAFELLAGRCPDVGVLKKSRAIVAALAKDDLAPIHAVENKQYPLFFMDTWWQDMLRHHGPLARGTVLGGAIERTTGGTTVLALLEFERGAEIFKLQWNGDTLGGVNIGPPYANRLRLVPESETSLIAYDLVAGLVLARAERGSGDGWDLKVGERARRIERRSR